MELSNDPKCKDISLKSLINLTIAKDETKSFSFGTAIKSCEVCVLSDPEPDKLCPVCQMHLLVGCAEMIKCHCRLHITCLEQMLNLGIGQDCPACGVPQIF